MRVCIAIVFGSACLALVGFCLCIREYSANMYQVFNTIRCMLFALYQSFYLICLHLARIEIHDAARRTWG